MEFFTGNPQSVRGLGNILLDKDELDMLEYYSEVSVGSDSVFETVMPVYSMSYLDDSEDDMTLPYNVNNFLLGAVASVSLANNKLEVNRYESTDLNIVTLRQLKHALSGKVKDITYENNVLRVVTFERSDLFGLQTKAAIVSLLTNVVSDVHISNNELVVERWSAADVAEGITRMEFEPYISVSATNPYLLSGEATDLVVSLVDEFGSPVDGELVTIGQSIFIDNGTTVSHNDDWVKYNPDNITITRGGEYTSVTGSNYRYGVPISNNCKIRCETRKPTASSGTLLSIWAYASNPLSASQLLTFSVTELGMTQGTFANLEMTVTPTTVTVKNLDNDTTITKEYSTTYNLLMNFWGTTFDYKNFKVYETINGVTDERGEFALHDVNVTDDTTFTATYDTVSDSVDVFLCTSYDYGTTNKNTNMWTLSNFTLSRGDSYSTLTEGSSTGTCTSDSSHKIAPTQTISFDLCQMDGTKYYAPIFIRNDGGGTSLAGISYSELNANVGEWVHVKIVFNNTSTITIYADTLAEPITKTLSATSTNYRLMLYGNNAITTLYFKNVAIY